MSSESEQLAVLDRIEDDGQAVLLVGEAEQERIVPVSKLPAGATAGSWLRVRFRGDRLVKAAIDVEQTEQVRQRVRKKMDRLRRRGRRLP